MTEEHLGRPQLRLTIEWLSKRAEKLERIIALLDEGRK